MSSKAEPRSLPWPQLLLRSPSHGSSPLRQPWILILVAPRPSAVPPALGMVADSCCSQFLGCIIAPYLASQIFHCLCNQSPLLNSPYLKHLEHILFSWWALTDKSIHSKLSFLPDYTTLFLKLSAAKDHLKIFPIHHGLTLGPTAHDW